MFGTVPFDENQGALLNQKLGPEYISDRAGPGGKKVQYIEGWRAVETANQVLGFNGWSSQIISQTVDFIDQDSTGLKFSVGVCSTIRITLKDGSYREDVGYGMSENNKSRGMALENARKSSVTDGIKRTLKHFGNALGGCFNSKDYLKSIKRFGKPLAKDLEASDLRRHPDYRSKVSNLVVRQPQNHQAGNTVSNSTNNALSNPTPVINPYTKPGSTSNPVQQTTKSEPTLNPAQQIRQSTNVQTLGITKPAAHPEDDSFSDVDDTLNYADINLDNYPVPVQASPAPKGLPRSISEGFPVNKNWKAPPRRPNVIDNDSNAKRVPYRMNEPPQRQKKSRIDDFDIPGFT